MEMNTRLAGGAPGDRDASPASIWWSGSCASRRARACRKQQNEIIRNGGFAVEARLYAEDPAPRIPAERRPRSRTCAGPMPLPVCASTSASMPAMRYRPFYDPMLGKVIAWGESRGAADRSIAPAPGRHRDRGRDHQPRAADQRARRRRNFARGGGRHEFSQVRRRASALRRAGRPASWMPSWRRCGTQPGESDGDALWADSRGWRLAAPPEQHLGLRRSQRGHRSCRRRIRYLARVAGREDLRCVCSRASDRRFAGGGIRRTGAANCT